MPTRRHHSSRRAPALKDSDFDHEINLVDHSIPEQRVYPASSVLGDEDDIAGPLSDRAQVAVADDTTVQSHPSASASNPVLEEGREDAVDENILFPHDASPAFTDCPSVQVQEPVPPTDPEVSIRMPTQKPKIAEPKYRQSMMDILYENQRGAFLCGIPLFASKALGNLDPSSWTNSAHKPSPTDIRTAQVPDPSWEWAWPAWRINHGENVDEEGWTYSFAFSKKFSWHQAKWWNSFVRRRAWIRRRMKRDEGSISQDPHMLNPDYFTVRASSDSALDRSEFKASMAGGTSQEDGSISYSTTGTEAVSETPVVVCIQGLIKMLRASKIDREKIEAVEKYLQDGEDDLLHLQDRMHDIMAVFCFQASRRTLLTRLTETYDETSSRYTTEGDSHLERKRKNLEAAIQHADEEVRRLEYWSDVKGMAEGGDSMGAIKHGSGWDCTWQGVDTSRPLQPGPKGL